MRLPFVGAWNRVESDPSSRAVEATPTALVASGAAGGFGVDPVDGDVGYRQLGSSRREVPYWTLEKSRAYSVAAYRTNPMARAIIDTYVSFCVGDKGVVLNCANPEVKATADDFWTDHRNQMAKLQPAFLRDHLLIGETVLEMLVGPSTGVTRFSPIDATRVSSIGLFRGNPLWPATVEIRDENGETTSLDIVQFDDITQLRVGNVQFWASWKALLTDRRGQPFLGPILDWLDNYDQVLSNLIDRTALARYLVWDVTVEGDGKDIEKFLAERGGNHTPPSGSVEVHNKGITWEAKTAQTGAVEDTMTAGATLTQAAAGAGLSKHWLAEPDQANRATSITMAEPVRRRVGGVQNIWLDYQTELVRYAVDQAVAAGRLPAEVTIPGADGNDVSMAASASVSVTGPEIAQSDSKVTAEVLFNLSQALNLMVSGGVMTPEAAKVAAKKGWEDYVGIPYTPELDQSDGSAQDDLAQHIEDNPNPAGALKLAVAGSAS